jgi:hypothetical protein
MHIIKNKILQYNSLSLVINKIVTCKPMIGDITNIPFNNFNLGQWGEMDIAGCVQKHESEDMVKMFIF